MHLNETFTNGGVDSNLFPQSFKLLVGHHLHWVGLLLIIQLHHLFCQSFVSSSRSFFLCVNEGNRGSTEFLYEVLISVPRTKTIKIF